MPELKEEQKQAIFHDDGNILVSASAGSGKTFVMIERAIRLICEGKAKVREILAATFTEAAASEMKERLKKALSKKIAQGETRLAEQLSDIYTADICTLHAFCGRLIRTYFFVAGVSPDFKITDEDEASVLREEAMEKTFKEYYDAKEDWFLKLTDRYKSKRTDKSLKDIIFSLYDYCESEKDAEAFMRKSLDFYTESGFNRIKKEYADYFNKQIAPAERDLKFALDGFVSCECESGKTFAEGLLCDIAAIKEKGVYATKNYVKRNVPSALNKPKENVAKYKEKAVAARDALDTLAKRFSANLNDEESDFSALGALKENTCDLFKLTRRFGEIYAEKKREENALDFTDLERYALRVLDDEETRHAVKSRYKYVFVDEYQDVNGVQEEIISRVSDDNLFMVGDVKQSIYGFRGCRPEIFSNKMSKMTENGEKVVSLNCNFRSSDAVIKTVNEIFSYSMTKEYFGQDYKTSSMLVSGGLYGEDKDGRTELHLLLKQAEKREKEQPRIYDVLSEFQKEENENESDIAALVANVIRGELGKEYYDVKSERFKRVEYSDVVILARNKTGAYVEKLVSGLVARGIPVASEVKQNICDFPETATLIDALKLIDCFINDVPLVSVLKSAIGGFTEEDLAEIALYYADNCDDKRGGFYKAFEFYEKNAEGELNKRVKDFIAYFDEIRFLSDYFGAGGVLSRIVTDCKYEEYLLSEPDGEKKVKRVKRLLSLTRREGKKYTVAEFLKKAQNGGDSFTVSECGGENNVRVMTIHASKGLEFPVVIACGLERKTNSREESADVLSDRDYGFAVRYYDENRTFSETPLRGLVKEKLRENRMKEELRLFYVATTRAAYALHLTFEGKVDKRKDEFVGADKFLDYVPADIPVTEWNDGDFGLAEKTVNPRRILFGRTDDAAIAEMKKNFSYRYPYLEDCGLPLKTAVTAANRIYAEEIYEKSRSARGETDERKGITAHKIMELLDFSKAENFDEQIKTMINEGQIDEEQLSGVNLDRIKSAVLSEALGLVVGRTLYREKSFIAQVPAREIFDVKSDEPILIQGVIDLMAENEKDIIIIDYKYSAASPSVLERRYKKQLDLYSATAESLLGKKVVSKILVNLFSGETIEIS